MRRWRTALVALLLSMSSTALAQQPLWAADGASQVEPSAEATRQALRAMHWKSQLDITLARHALARASHPAVRRYAERVIRDHELADARALALADELRIDLRPPAAEEQAQTERAQELISEIQDLSGEEFERAWLRIMVNGHRQAIQQLAQLRPRVDAVQVQRLMRDLVPILDQHLLMARHLESGERIGAFRTGSTAPLWIQFVTQVWR